MIEIPEGYTLTNLALECGHPTSCLQLDEEEQSFCAWCQEVESLRSTAEALREQLTKQAIVVHGGEPTIEAAEIGYLAVYGGTVNIACERDVSLLYGLEVAKDDASLTN